MPLDRVKFDLQRFEPAVKLLQRSRGFGKLLPGRNQLDRFRRRRRVRPPGATRLADRLAIRWCLRVVDHLQATLSEREVELLRYLAGHAGRAISREEILARVWNIDPRGLSSRTIDMHVARLREKLRDDPTEPQIILTVRGQGYMFAALEEAK